MMQTPTTLLSAMPLVMTEPSGTGKVTGQGSGCNFADVLGKTTDISTQIQSQSSQSTGILTSQNQDFQSVHSSDSHSGEAITATVNQDQNSLVDPSAAANNQTTIFTALLTMLPLQPLQTSSGQLQNNGIQQPQAVVVPSSTVGDVRVNQSTGNAAINLTGQPTVMINSVKMDVDPNVQEPNQQNASMTDNGSILPLTGLPTQMKQTAPKADQTTGLVGPLTAGNVTVALQATVVPTVPSKQQSPVDHWKQTALFDQTVLQTVDIPGNPLSSGSAAPITPVTQFSSLLTGISTVQVSPAITAQSTAKILTVPGISLVTTGNTGSQAISSGNIVTDVSMNIKSVQLQQLAPVQDHGENEESNGLIKPLLASQVTAKVVVNDNPAQQLANNHSATTQTGETPEQQLVTGVTDRISDPTADDRVTVPKPNGAVSTNQPVTPLHSTRQELLNDAEQTPTNPPPKGLTSIFQRQPDSKSSDSGLNNQPVVVTVEKNNIGQDQPQTNDLFSAFVQHASSQSSSPIPEQDRQLPNVTPEQIMQQLTTKMASQQLDHANTMQIQLHPEHLGEVSVQVTVEQGKVSAQFMTDNSQVKQALETSMSQLKQQLSDQGYKVDYVSVNMSLNMGFSQQQQQQRTQQPFMKVRRHILNKDFENVVANTQLSAVSPVKMTEIDYIA